MTSSATPAPMTRKSTIGSIATDPTPAQRGAVWAGVLLTSLAAWGTLAWSGWTLISGI